MLAQQNTPTTAVRRVRWIALGAAELMSAVGEFHLAQEIGIHPSLAWLLPVALGVYGFCAFATGNRIDVFAALGLMIVCQGMAHLLAIGLIPRHWTLVLAASAVAPIVCWRVHHLGQHTPAVPADVVPLVEAAPLAPLVDAVPAADVAPAALTVHAEPVVVEPIEEAAPLVEESAAPARTRTNRSRAEWRTLIEAAQGEHPGFNRKELAAHLDISDRWLRACLNAA